MRNTNENTLCRRKAAALALVLLGALSPALADEAKPRGDLGRGAMLWADNCARCHNMRDPKEFNDDQWRVVVTHMRVRAGFTGQDTRDMLTFLQASN
ncbi:MAG TPA: hypothetical protein VN277_00695 [Acidiferrobacterales bacterium]|nr:hypothetical protein [Acidiferrobacterales bacterium]